MERRTAILQKRPYTFWLRKIQIELPLPPPKAAAELISLPGAADDPMQPLTTLQWLAARRQSLTHGEHVPDHGEEMADAPGEDEEMPDSVTEGQLLRHIEQSAHCVADASREQPGHAVGTDGVHHLGCCDYYEPTHEEISD